MSKSKQDNHFETILWDSAKKLRGSVESSVKHAEKLIKGAGV